MSTLNANFCPAALFSLTMAGINNPNNLVPRGGSLLALNTPESRRAGEMIRLVNDNGTGHVRDVRTVYKPRRTKNAVTNTKDCEVGPYLGYVEDTFEPNNFSQISFSVPEDSVRLYCESYSRLVKISGAEVPNPAVLIGNPNAEKDLWIMQELANELMSQMNAMVQSINSDILDIAQGYAGTYQGGAATTAFPIQNADGSVNAVGLQNFRQQLKKTGFEGVPHIITGYGAADRIWDNDTRYFCCAENGINYDVAVSQDKFRLFIDENVSEILGSDANAIIFYPGSLILTPVPQYVGNFGRIGVEERVRVPFYGIPNLKLDLRIQGIPCDNVYAMWLEFKWDLWGAPTSMFESPDFQAGINGIFQATFTQA